MQSLRISCTADVYRQGFHYQVIKNNGQRPLNDWLSEQLKSQIEYIFRGNYGLVSDDELRPLCRDENEITRMINVKKFFAFGRIGRQEDLIEQIPVSEDLQQIKDSVSIRRIGITNSKLRTEKKLSL